MTKKKSLKGRNIKGRKSSRFLLFVLIGVIIGLVYYFNNNFSASTNSTVKISEVFEQITTAPESYQIRLVDENGANLSPELISKISVSSLIVGKDCGPKGSTVTHPKGGCFVVDKAPEVPVVIDSASSASFQSKLFHVTQTFKYTNGKEKIYHYYFSGIGSGTNFVAWKTNTIVIKSASDKEEIARIPITSNVYFQTKLDKAQNDITGLNKAVKIIKIPTSKIVSTLGSNAGTPATPVATVSTPTPIVEPVQPVLSANAIASGSALVKFIKNGIPVSGQNYQVYNVYYECTIAEGKEKDCTRTKKYLGEKGISGTDGIVKFKTELMNIGNDYFIGENISAGKFRIWSKSEVVALNADGKRIGSKTVSSPFYRPKFSILFIALSMDSTERNDNKQKMLDKYNKLFSKEYIIKVR